MEQLIVRVGGDISGLTSSLSQATGDIGRAQTQINTHLSKVGEGFANAGKIAGGVMLGMAGTVAGAVAGMGAMVMKSAETADNTQQLADTYGLTAERIQELRYAGTKLDVDLETITGTQSKLIKAMAAAEKPTSAQALAFKSLGISVTDGSGHLRDSNVVFTEAIDKLHAMPNLTERNAISLKLFGKSAMELNPLLNAGGKALSDLSEEAHKTGAVMSNEAIAGMDKFKDNFDALKLSFGGIAGTLSSTLMPQLQGFVELAQTLAGSLAKALKTGNFDEFGAILSKGLTDGITMVTNGITKLMPVIVKVLTSIISALIKAIPIVLPALTKAVIDLLNAFIDLLSTNGVMLIEAAITMITTLIDGIVTALPKLIPLAVKLILALVDALVKTLPQLIDAAIQIILALVLGLVDALPIIIKEMPKIIKAIVDGIVTALPKLLDAAIQIIMCLVDFFTDPANLTMLIDSTIQIILAVVEGLAKCTPILFAALGKLFEALWNKFIDYDWGQLGICILNGIISGLNGLADMMLAPINAVIDALNQIPGTKIARLKIEIPKMDTGSSTPKAGEMMGHLALASGGLAYGPTLAMVGDNINSASDPEVISPLSKLKDMLGKTMQGQNTTILEIDGVQFGKIVNTSGQRFRNISGNPRLGV